MIQNLVGFDFVFLPDAFQNQAGMAVSGTGQAAGPGWATRAAELAMIDLRPVGASGKHDQNRRLRRSGRSLKSFLQIGRFCRLYLVYLVIAVACTPACDDNPPVSLRTAPGRKRFSLTMT
jgi:hypothetical protein